MVCGPSAPPAVPSVRRLARNCHACNVDVVGHPLTAAKMEKTRRILPYQHLVWGRARGMQVDAWEGPLKTAKFTFHYNFTL